MTYGVKLHVWGDYACFTRAEMKVERVSYDVMTPSAARGILEAIYWKPAIRWNVDKIHVLKPIRWQSIRRNEVASVISARTVKKHMTNRTVDGLRLVSDKDRVQRAATVLRDVGYVIEAHFDMTGKASEKPDDTEEKHFAMFCERAKEGQCYHRPYLGTREFAADFNLIDGEYLPRSTLPREQRDQDLGWMLLDFDFGKTIQPRFFRAKMDGEIIHVPPMHSVEVRA